MGNRLLHWHEMQTPYKCHSAERTRSNGIAVRTEPRAQHRAIVHIEYAYLLLCIQVPDPHSFIAIGCYYKSAEGIEVYIVHGGRSCKHIDRRTRCGIPDADGAVEARSDDNRAVGRKICGAYI